MGNKCVCAPSTRILLTLGARGDSQEQAYRKAGKMLDDGKAKEFKALGSCEDASRMARYAQACSDDISFTWDSYSGDGDIVLVEENGKYGYIDAAGKLVIPCEWEEADSFSEGFARVGKDGKYGYIDTAGRLVVPCEWEEADFFSEGLACVGKDGKYGSIDSAGRTVISCEWDDMGFFSEGLVCVGKNGKYGYIDSAGKLVIPCEWDDAGSFSGGLARVEKDGKYGYIDTAGRLAIPCEWDDVGRFGGGGCPRGKEWEIWLYRYDRQALCSLRVG